jgi:hypothetical protein
MNPILMSMLSFVFIASSFFSWIILPLINLNIITNSEADLHERIQIIIDKQRAHPDAVLPQILNLKTSNIEIVSADKSMLADYHVFMVRYRFSKILFNNFFGFNDLAKTTKSKFFLVDRSDI